MKGKGRGKLWGVGGLGWERDLMGRIKRLIMELGNLKEDMGRIG